MKLRTNLRKRRVVNLHLLAAGTTFIVGAAPNAALAFGLTVYSVDDYDPCGALDLPGADNSADGFMDGVQGYFPADTVRQQNNSVYQNRMRDPALVSGGVDSTYGWDRVSTRIVYWAGHGTGAPGGNVGGGPTLYNCGRPQDPLCSTRPTPAGHKNPVVCRKGHPQSVTTVGKCRWQYAHGPVTCSSTDGSSTKKPKYSKQFTNHIRFERPTAVFFDMSFPAHYGSEPDDLGGMFNGVRLVATMHVVTGDSAVPAARGTSAGSLAYNFPNAAISDTWLDAASMVSTGSGCYPGGPTAQGINGCGGHIVLSGGVSHSAAHDAHDITWDQADSSWVQQAHYTVTRKTCNYDCLTYPIIVPG